MRKSMMYAVIALASLFICPLLISDIFNLIPLALFGLFLWATSRFIKSRFEESKK